MKNFIKKLKKFFGYVDTEGYLTYMSNLISDYEKVCRVIDSCKNQEQIISATNLIYLFCYKYQSDINVEQYKKDIFKILEDKLKESYE